MNCLWQLIALAVAHTLPQLRPAVVPMLTNINQEWLLPVFMVKLFGDEPLPSSQWTQRTREETTFFHLTHPLADQKLEAEDLEKMRAYA